MGSDLNHPGGGEAHRPMGFDFRVSLGELILVATVLLTAFGFVYEDRARVEVLASRMDDLKEEVRDMRAQLRQMADRMNELLIQRRAANDRG